MEIRYRPYNVVILKSSITYLTALFPPTKKRGNDILGLADTLGADHLPYSTLSYDNGKSFDATYDPTGVRRNLTNSNFTDPYLRYMVGAGTATEAHGGEDVGVYAIGPWSHLFAGNYEQNNIPVAMAYAAQIGPYAKKAQGVVCSAAQHLRPLVISWMIVFLAALLAFMFDQRLT